MKKLSKLIDVRSSALVLLLILPLFASNQILSIQTSSLTGYIQKAHIAFAAVDNNNSKNNNKVTSNKNITTYSSITTNETTQKWIDKLSQVKIGFSYFPNYAFYGNILNLKFTVQDLKTGNIYLKGLSARVTIINNLTSAKLNKLLSIRNGDFSTFNNTSAASDDSFSLKYQFNEPGIHPDIFRVDSKNFSSLSSFNVIVHSEDG